MHARWRHFVFDGRDLWARARKCNATWPDAAARARACVRSRHYLRAARCGRRTAWAYQRFGDWDRPLRVRKDSRSRACAGLPSGGVSSGCTRSAARRCCCAYEQSTTAALNAAFRCRPQIRSPALPGRAAAAEPTRCRPYSGTGSVCAERFAAPGWACSMRSRSVQAVVVCLPALILEVLLDAFGSIWHGRPTLDGVPLGDCWPHPALDGPSPADRYAPLHKLSQWLTYSLIEPLTASGHRGPCRSMASPVSPNIATAVCSSTWACSCRVTAVSGRRPTMFPIRLRRRMARTDSGACSIELAPLVRERLGVDDRSISARAACWKAARGPQVARSHANVALTAGLPFISTAMGRCSDGKCNAGRSSARAAQAHADARQDDLDKRAFAS